jgi:hypothetical protein
MFCSLLAAVTSAYGDRADDLKGLDGFGSVVITLGDRDDAKAFGLYEERLRTLAELTLRREGLLVSGQRTGFVSVTVRVVKLTTGQQETVAGGAFVVILGAGAWLKADPYRAGQTVAATLWASSNIAARPQKSVADGVDEVLRQLLDTLLNDYYKANPKAR